MLTRMYNLGLHTRLPMQDVPWQWMMHWSRILENDLQQRRLEARMRAGKRSARPSRGRTMA